MMTDTAWNFNSSGFCILRMESLKKCKSNLQYRKDTTSSRYIFNPSMAKRMLLIRRLAGHPYPHKPYDGRAGVRQIIERICHDRDAVQEESYSPP